jgi:hypothetical protein
MRNLARYSSIDIPSAFDADNSKSRHRTMRFLGLLVTYSVPSGLDKKFATTFRISSAMMECTPPSPPAE